MADDLSLDDLIYENLLMIAKQTIHQIDAGGHTLQLIAPDETAVVT